MSSYRIGIYNPKIETDEKLKNCDIIFDSFDKLKAHVREGDEILYVSEFSFFEYDHKEFISLIKEKMLRVNSYKKIVVYENNIKNEILSLEILLSINDVIKENIEVIRKL